MKKKHVSKIKQQQKSVSAPETLDSKKNIKSFSTFEEMEMEQLTFYSKLQPLELLKNHKHISMAAFGFKNENEFAKPDRKIKFD